MFYTLNELKQMHAAPIEYLNAMREDCLCGAPIVRNLTFTKARCSSSHCPYHMSFRAARMFQYLGIKGFGNKTCQKLISSLGALNHFELLGHVLSYKPELYLWEIAKLECMDGYDEQCENIFAGYGSFEEYFKREGDIPSVIREHALYLVRAQQYFKVKRPLSRNNVKIALHGSIPGFRNRDLYISYLNNKYGKLVRTVQKSSAGPSNFVVTTEKDSGHRKITDAKKFGIPILTPAEYELELIDIIKRHLKNGNISDADMDAYLEDLEKRKQ